MDAENGMIMFKEADHGRRKEREETKKKSRVVLKIIAFVLIAVIAGA